MPVPVFFACRSPLRRLPAPLAALLGWRTCRAALLVGVDPKARLSSKLRSVCALQAAERISARGAPCLCFPTAALSCGCALSSAARAAACAENSRSGGAHGIFCVHHQLSGGGVHRHELGGLHGCLALSQLRRALDHAGTARPPCALRAALSCTGRALCTAPSLHCGFALPRVSEGCGFRGAERRLGWPRGWG